jgi:hypothetical protein
MALIKFGKHTQKREVIDEMNTAYRNGKSVYRGKDGCITIDGLSEEEAEQAIEYGQAKGLSIRKGTQLPPMPDLPRK